MTARPEKSLDNVGSESGELTIIGRIRRRAALSSRREVRLGIGDDCAILRPRRGEELAVTTDLSIAGRHFRIDLHPPESAGHRALARGLSDLAAMGARPVAAFLSLAVPRSLTRAARRNPSLASLPNQPAWPGWTDRFLEGLFALAATCKVPLAGGDLAESPIPLADIVLVGAVPRGRALLRSAARPGHLLYVTGSLGGSAAALSQLTALAESAASSGSKPPRIPKKLANQLAPHLYPQPRVAQGLWLQRRNLGAAAIDISDGLSTDLAHLCEESHVAAEVDSALLPIPPGATLAQALHGGEDYELLFTVPAATRIPRQIAGVPITRIGRILRARAGHPAVTLLTAQGSEPLGPKGWSHFS